MKKRRELDALVTNGKLPRRKSKSGHELLRSNDSDSSEVEEFSVPIGIKAGKKWIGICPCSSCVALLVFIVMTSCLIACAGLIWMHFELKRDLDNLRERLLTVENRNQGAPEEFQKYHSQIQELNKTVHSLRAGDKGIDKIGQNLTQMANQLDSLKKVTDGLKEDLQKAPLLKDLPNRFDSLTSTVAKMGSDVQNANTQLESLDDFKKAALANLDDLRKRISDLENKTTTTGHSTSGREHGSPLSVKAVDDIQWGQRLQVLSQDIDNLNNSLTTKILALNSTVLMYDTRLSLLEQFTAKMAKSSENNKADVTDALNELLSADKKSDGKNAASTDLSALSSVLEKVDNITAMVASLGQHYDKLDAEINDVKSYKSASPGTETDEFTLFQTETVSNLEYLNSTLMKTTEHVDHLFKLFTQNRNELNNITAHLSGLINYFSTYKNASSASHEAGMPSTTQKSSLTSSTVGSTTTAASKLEESVAPVIKMNLVHNLKDLEVAFNRWDRNGVGQVNPDDLQDFMPDPPTSEQLKPFDANNNGKYSLEEFKAALGFSSDTATEEVKHIFE